MQCCLSGGSLFFGMTVTQKSVTNRLHRYKNVKQQPQHMANIMVFCDRCTECMCPGWVILEEQHKKTYITVSATDDCFLSCIDLYCCLCPCVQLAYMRDKIHRYKKTDTSTWLFQTTNWFWSLCCFPYVIEDIRATLDDLNSQTALPAQMDIKPLWNKWKSCLLLARWCAGKGLIKSDQLIRTIKYWIQNQFPWRHLFGLTWIKKSILDEHFNFHADPSIAECKDFW